MSATPHRSRFSWYDMRPEQLAQHDVSPEEGVERYLSARQNELAKQTLRRHRYVLRSFIEYCEDDGIEYLSDLEPWHFDGYKTWREAHGVKAVTVRGDMVTLKAFIRKMTEYRMVNQGLYDTLRIPNVEAGEERSEEVLDAQEGAELIHYLRRFHYANRSHVVLTLLMETGIRSGTLKALDVGDLHLDGEPYIYPRHRPEEDTPLKNGDRGSRPIAITRETAQLLEDHIHHHRYDVTDAYGREPLITTSRGRASKQTIRRVVYEATAPCFRGRSCPGCKADSPRDEKCPESVGPHAVRHYYITKCKKEGLPIDAISDRCNVSAQTIERHYVHMTPNERMEATRDLFAKVKADGDDDGEYGAPTARLP